MGLVGSRTVAHEMKHCTLWKADRSPACRAVMMAIDAMNLSVSEIDLDLDKLEHTTDEMVAMNPLQTLPVFKDRELILNDRDCDAADSRVRSRYSHAICSYLVSRYCLSDYLLPKDPGGRSLVDQCLHYNGGVLYPRFRAAAYPILYDNRDTLMPQQICDIECAYSDLEVMLKDRMWYGGAWPTLGDIAFASTVSTLNILVPIDEHRFPKLSSWLYRISKEHFYITGNYAGLEEFSKRLDHGVFTDECKLTCPRTSCRRRAMAEKSCT